ncbi:MAG: hypothetical protein FJW40_02090 [Acidobacteria bacterium]|nr:hypothetical protein [Acidobacteriota bacterium]
MKGFLMAGLAVYALQAQDPHVIELHAPPPGVGGIRTEGRAMMFAGGDHTVEFIGLESAVAGRQVKGAPYSADSVTESIQAMADGNRIVRKNTAAVYRDGEGRTRREQSLSGLGPWATKGEPEQLVMIEDPVAKVHWSLDPKNKIARKFTFPEGAGRFEFKTDTTAGGVKKVENIVIQRGPGGPGGGPAGGPASATFTPFMAAAMPGGQMRTEQLGTRTIEGLVAKGTRTIHTIPAGAVGNERPIEVTSESWYSEELQTTVLTRHNDPRNGERTFKLQNVRRGEPSKLLFEPPADYKVEDVKPRVVNLTEKK